MSQKRVSIEAEPYYAMTPEERIDKRRMELGIPIEKVAEVIGVTIAHVWDLDGMENEFAGTLLIEQALKYVNLLNLNIFEVLGEPEVVSSPWFSF